VPEETFQERTEPPTDKRRQDARRKGNVAKSTEINSVLILLGGLLVLRIGGRWMLERVAWMFKHFFGMISTPEISEETARAVATEAFAMVARITLPLVAVVVVLGILANVLQVGLLLTGEPLTPKLEKINPLSGLKRMFAVRSLVEALKNIMKIVIIGVVAYLTIRGEFRNFLGLADTASNVVYVFMLTVAYKIVFRIVLILLFLAVLDYAYQRYEHEKNLKMTREEVKEERKQMEGDPQIKSRIRSLQREMGRRRMMQEVPRATVVVTNPTYLAIALRYEPVESDAPMVLAKGKRAVAEKIRAVAEEHDIPLVEDKPLARAMYDRVEPGEQIPMEFFTAVAEILAYVYRLKNKAAA